MIILIYFFGQLVEMIEEETCDLALAKASEYSLARGYTAEAHNGFMMVDITDLI